MSTRGLPASLLSVVALVVLSVVAVTAVTGWSAVSIGLGAVAAVVFLALAVRALRRRRRPAVDEAPALAPVAELSTEALGREWLRTASALAEPLAAQTRQHVARRRQDTLDELERRDPVGFAHWLADDSPVSRNPAEFVRGERPA